MRPHPTSKLLKVVILGNGGIGKTCLMNRFVSDQYDENSFHTIGVEFLKKDLVVDGSRYTLQVRLCAVTDDDLHLTLLSIADLGYCWPGAVQSTAHSLLPWIRHLPLSIRRGRPDELSRADEVARGVPEVRRRGRVAVSLHCGRE